MVLVTDYEHYKMIKIAIQEILLNCVRKLDFNFKVNSLTLVAAIKLSNQREQNSLTVLKVILAIRFCGKLIPSAPLFPRKYLVLAPRVVAQLTSWKIRGSGLMMSV